ncbi:MAG: hypothetical protein WD424_07165 [Paenibacillaceae bacterium]
MNITISKARMNYDIETGYTGQVEFAVEGHKCPYEVMMHSLKGNEWSYGLHFLGEPGNEEEIFALDEYIEDNDECFDQLIEAARKTCENDPRAGSENRPQLY